MAASLPPVIARSSGFLERFCYWLESKRRGESERVTFRFPSFPASFPSLPDSHAEVCGWLADDEEGKSRDLATAADEQGPEPTIATLY